MTSSEPSWLRHAAQRAALEPWSLGALLASCRESESSSFEVLADELGCDIHTFFWLCLCRLPSEEGFAADVGKISARFGIERLRLVALIRRAQALTSLGSPANEGTAEHQLLLAARDKNEGQKEP